MRYVAAVFSLLCAVSCTGGEVIDPPDPVIPTEPAIDTGWPPGDLANLHIVHHVNTGSTGVFAAFTQSSPGYVNMAECAIRESLCVAGFASDEDDYEDIDDEQEVDKEATVTRFAGFEITYGPYTLPYREDPDSHFGYYYLDASGEDLPEGWIGASWGGQWPDYESDHDLDVSAPIEIIQPAAGTAITFTNGQVVPLEWVPTGEGLVTLSIFTQFSLARMYQLEDDGYFALDADSLGLTADTEDLTFVFARWDQAQLIEKGNVINFVASSDVFFTGTYLQIGVRTYITPADQCDEAQGSPPLQAGEWWGNLGGRINGQLNPFNGCLQGQYANAAGNDAIFRIDVEPHHAISVDYNLFTESAAVYFLNDCNNIDTCFAGNDQSADPNIHEYLNFFNVDADTPRQIFLVIDATETGDTVFTLDVTNSELIAPDMYDTCEEAQLATPTLTSAVYYQDFLGYANDLDPGPGGCTATALPNPDSMTPFTLLAGETITASVNMPGGDAAIYLLYNCLDEFSCAAGMDGGLIGATEQVTYTNMGVGSENLYLVVDAKSSLQPYFLTVTIGP